MLRRVLSLVAIAAAGGATSPADLAGQDTTWKEGVRITGIYSAGMARPSVLVMPVATPGGDSLRAILQRDLDHGDRITVVALPAEDVPPLGGDGAGPNYPVYVKMGASLLLQISETPSGIHVVIHNAAGGRIERVKAFPLPAEAGTPGWRLALHTVADEIEQQITGVRGVAATRILYVSQGRVWQVDADGANPTALTSDVGAYSPAWNPRGTHIAFQSVTNAGHQVVVRESGGATRTLNLGSGALVMTPAFAPDGSTMAYAFGRENGVDLYAINVFSAEPARRITVGRGRDNVSPTFSPDGRQIAFTSDRAGPKNIYVSDADGTNAEPLIPVTIGDQVDRSSPDWSPDGRLIAFQSMIEGRYQVLALGVRDRSVKAYTSAGTNEDPSWAPDSRHLVFTSTRSGTRQLWVVDTESGRFRQLTHAPAPVRLAAWSRSLTIR